MIHRFSNFPRPSCTQRLRLLVIHQCGFMFSFKQSQPLLFVFTRFIPILPFCFAINWLRPQYWILLELDRLISKKSNIPCYDITQWIVLFQPINSVWLSDRYNPDRFENSRFIWKKREREREIRWWNLNWTDYARRSIWMWILLSSLWGYMDEDMH